METLSIIYWATTGLFAVAMTFSAYAYLTQPAMKKTFEHLGYPAHFRRQLAVAKLLGVIVLLAPVSPLLKEWAYAGFVFTCIAAFVSHSARGDSAAERLGPLVVLAVLAASYMTYHPEFFN
jgi:hypothetical protein